MGESDIIGPLRDLLKGDTEWQWTEHHDRAWEKIKAVLTSDPTLSFYDVERPIKIQADASQSGLGACLLQDGSSVAYASRTRMQLRPDRKGNAGDHICVQEIPPLHIREAHSGGDRPQAARIHNEKSIRHRSPSLPTHDATATEVRARSALQTRKGRTSSRRAVTRSTTRDGRSRRRPGGRHGGDGSRTRHLSTHERNQARGDPAGHIPGS